MTGAKGTGPCSLPRNEGATLPDALACIHSMALALEGESCVHTGGQETRRSPGRFQTLHHERQHECSLFSSCRQRSLSAYTSCHQAAPSRLWPCACGHTRAVEVTPALPGDSWPCVLPFMDLRAGQSASLQLLPHFPSWLLSCVCSRATAHMK